MKKICKWLLPLLIGAMVMPTFVGCETDGTDSDITTDGDVTVDGDADTDGDGNADVTTDALTPDEQKSQLQTIATTMIETIDVNSTAPILAALDAMIERMDDVSAPEQLEWVLEDLDDYFDSDDEVSVDIVPDFPMDDSDYYDGDFDDTYYEGDDSIYYSQYSATKITPLASIRDMVAGDISVLNSFATISTKSEEMDINTLGYLADVYGTYTLNDDDTWTYAEASNELTFIVDGYKLTMAISGELSVNDIEYTENDYYEIYDGDTYTSGYESTDYVVSITIPQSVSITFSSNGSTLVALEANVTELDVMTIKANASATASFADFTVTSTNVIGDGAGSLVNELTYNGTSLLKASATYADLDSDSIWDAVDSESADITVGGLKVACEVFGGALCVTGTVSNVGDFVAEMDAIDNKYVWHTYSSTTDDSTGITTSYYTYGPEEGYSQETTDCLNNYFDIYWGFGSTSDVQGKIEFDYEYETYTNNYSYGNYVTYDTYNDYYILPILVFGDESRIDIDSFFTETSFSGVIDTAMDLVDDMTTLMGGYSNLY